MTKRKAKSRSTRSKPLPKTRPKTLPEAPFEASSLDPCITPLGMHKTPRLYYTPKVHWQLSRLIAMAPKEVSWWGLVDNAPDSSEYLVTELFIPKQIVTCATAEIDGDAMNKLYTDLLTQGKDPSKLIYWGHSHVDMGVSPSGTDENQAAAFLIPTCPILFRGIYNKRGASKVDCFDQNLGLIFESIVNGLKPYVPTENEIKALEDTYKTNVEEMSPGTPSYNAYGTYNQYPVQKRQTSPINALSRPRATSSIPLDSWESESDFYPKLTPAQLHYYALMSDNELIHAPELSAEDLDEILEYQRQQIDLND